MRVKLKRTPDGDVIDQLFLSRAKPEVKQTLTVRGIDALSVLDKCAVRSQDISFDGYNDLYVDTHAGAANTYALYWVYDPTQRAFHELGEYPEFQVDASHKRLKTYERNGVGGLEYDAREYSFVDGVVVLERQEVQVPLPEEDTFERTVSIRSGGSMRVLNKRRVRSR